jgi:hypothetical protein
VVVVATREHDGLPGLATVTTTASLGRVIPIYGCCSNERPRFGDGSGVQVRDSVAEAETRRGSESDSGCGGFGERDRG